MDRMLLILKNMGYICRCNWAIYHYIQICLLVYIADRSQVIVYRDIGFLVIFSNYERVLEFASEYPCCVKRIS